MTKEWISFEAEDEDWRRIAQLTEFEEGWGKFSVKDILLKEPRTYESKPVTALNALEKKIPAEYSLHQVFYIVPIEKAEFKAAEPPVKLTNEDELAEENKSVGLRYNSEIDDLFQRVRENIRKVKEPETPNPDRTVTFDEL